MVSGNSRQKVQPRSRQSLCFAKVLRDAFPSRALNGGDSSRGYFAIVQDSEEFSAIVANPPACYRSLSGPKDSCSRPGWVAMQ